MERRTWDTGKEGRGGKEGAHEAGETGRKWAWRCPQSRIYSGSLCVRPVDESLHDLCGHFVLIGRFHHLWHPVIPLKADTTCGEQRKHTRRPGLPLWTHVSWRARRTFVFQPVGRQTWCWSDTRRQSRSGCSELPKLKFEPLCCRVTLSISKIQPLVK